MTREELIRLLLEDLTSGKGNADDLVVAILGDSPVEVLHLRVTEVKTECLPTNGSIVILNLARILSREKPTAEDLEAGLKVAAQYKLLEE